MSALTEAEELIRLRQQRLNAILQESPREARPGQAFAMFKPLEKLGRAHSLIFGATLAFAAVVEAAHMRRYIQKGPKDRIVFTAVAAATCLYIASECLEGSWPSWAGYGYDG